MNKNVSNRDTQTHLKRAFSSIKAVDFSVPLMEKAKKRLWLSRVKRGLGLGKVYEIKAREKETQKPRRTGKLAEFIFPLCE